jgi:hypothetical protein
MGSAGTAINCRRILGLTLLRGRFAFSPVRAGTNIVIFSAKRFSASPHHPL